MRTFQQTVDGDLALVNGQLNLTTNQATHIAHSLRNRLRFFAGEWFLDTRLGVPYFQLVLVKNPDVDVIRRLLVSVITETSPLIEIQSLDLEITPERVLLVTFQLRVAEDTIYLDDNNQFFVNGEPLVVDPVPVLTSITSIPDTGGLVTATGANFLPGAVLWTDGAARVTTYVNATTLTATVPAHAAGTVSAYVVQSSGTSGTVNLTYTQSLVNLSTRTASVYLVSDDYNAGTPERLMGRASVGDSVNACYRRDLYAAYVGRGDDTANPTTVNVGGKKWLVTSGSSAGAIINAAGNAERKRSHVLGAQNGAWSMTVACSWATLFGTTPQTFSTPFGSTLYTCYVCAAADGRVGVVALADDGNTYQYVCLPPGSVTVGERCIIQVQSDGTQARVRKHSGGVTGAWTTPAPFTLYTVDSIWTMLAHSRNVGPAFSGEFGGAFVEQSYVPDMNAILASFANEVGLP